MSPSRLAVGLLMPFVFLLTAGVRAQSTQPTTRPGGWAEVDPRLVFLTMQLANVENSIDATTRALKGTSYRMTVRADDAARYVKGNELMDRNGGAPVRWQDFYGRTARRFYYDQPSLQVDLRSTRNALDGNCLDDVTIQPIDIRPPQFDYIYRANNDGMAKAAADIASLAGKVDELLARRRQLEAEQAGLWCKIAFRAVAGQELLRKPLYRYDLKADENGGDKLAAMEATMDFLRINNWLIERAEKGIEANPAEFFANFEKTVISSRDTFDTRLSRLATLAAFADDKTSTLGKLNALARRMNDVARNVGDAHKLAIDGDQAADESRKQFFRRQLQGALMTYAEAVDAADDCVTQLSRDWRISPNYEKLVGTQKAVVIPDPPRPEAARVEPAKIEPPKPEPVKVEAPQPQVVFIEKLSDVVDPPLRVTPPPVPPRVVRPAIARPVVAKPTAKAAQASERTKWETDQAVMVKWGGMWFDAHVLGRHDGDWYLIGYDRDRTQEWVEWYRIYERSSDLIDPLPPVTPNGFYHGSEGPPRVDAGSPPAPWGRMSRPVVRALQSR